VSGEVRPFHPEEDAPAVRAIMEASLANDAIPGFIRADIDRALVRMVPDPGGTLVAVDDDGVIVGYCTPRNDDLTVRPDARRRGHGRRLVHAAIPLVRERGLTELQLYVPLHLPGSNAFARAMGMTYRSSLWQFELPARRPVPPPAFGSDLVIRRWDPARDTDFDAWATFMLAAFEGHPTPMSWTAAVLRHVHAAPDFDASGILLVAEAADPAHLVAFTRVELFDAERPAGERTGDVGLIGVLPAWRRRGLGRELLRWGIHELRGRGAGRIELSVEAANDRATALYRAHGFEPAIKWPHWVLPVT
jgi:mycothiol synthase